MYGKKELEFLSVVNSCLVNNAALLERVSSVERFLDAILDIRELHSKLHKESEFYMMPNYDVYEKQGLVKGVQYIRDLYIEIKKVCEEVGITVFFTKKDSIEYSKRIFVIYRIGESNISGLVYYNKIEKERTELNLEELNLD